MKNTGNLIRCACGRLYEFFNMFCGDQSCCPKCRQALSDEYERQEKGDVIPGGWFRWRKDRHGPLCCRPDFRPTRNAGTRIR